MALSAFVVYLLARKGDLNRKDGVLRLIIYGIFLVTQSVIEGVGVWSRMPVNADSVCQLYFESKI